MPTTIALQNKIAYLEAKYKACTGRSAYTIGNQLRSLKYDLRESLITDLSNKFSQIVRDNFSKEDLATVNDLNKQSNYKGCCALHDFCDANMLMDEAFTVIVGRLTYKTKRMFTCGATHGILQGINNLKLNIMQGIKIEITIQPYCSDTTIKEVLNVLLVNEIKEIKDGLKTGSFTVSEEISYTITSAV